MTNIEKGFAAYLSGHLLTRTFAPDLVSAALRAAELYPAMDTELRPAERRSFGTAHYIAEVAI